MRRKNLPAQVTNSHKGDHFYFSSESFGKIFPARVAMRVVRGYTERERHDGKSAERAKAGLSRGICGRGRRHALQEEKDGDTK